MKWIKNHKIISVIIAVLILSAGMMIASIASGGAGNGATGAAGTVITTIERPFSAAAGAIYSNISGILSYKDLQKENDQLQSENEKLKQELINMKLTNNELTELKSLSKALNYKGISGSSDIVSGDVISMDGTNWMNIFTIDVGTESGIKTGDVVYCGDGLVGRVQSCGKNWSKVVSIIDENSKVSFKVSGNLQLIGVVEGSSDGTLSGFMLDSKAKVAEGDRIITSGMGIYPAGIEIGKVTKVKYDSDEQLEKVNIKPSVSFATLQKVSVIL